MGNITVEAWILSTGVSYATASLALAAVGANDTVLLSEGQFTEDVTYTQAGLTLVGAGIEKTIINGEVSFGGHDDSKIQDLTVKGVSGDTVSGDACSRLTIFRCVFIGDDSNRVFSIANASNVVVDDVKISAGSDGVYLTNDSADANNIRLRNLYISDVALNGIFLDRDVNYSLEAFIEDVYISDYSRNGIYAKYATAKIKNAIITDGLSTGYAALNIHTINGGVADVECTNSTFIRNTGYGVELQTDSGSALVEVRGCAIYDNGEYDCIVDAALDMEYNWWGTDTPAGGQFSGSVDYTPSFTMVSGIGTLDAVLIADAVWEEAKADHTGTSTFGDLATDIDTLMGDITVDIDIPEPMHVPTGATAVNDSATMLIGDTTVTVDNTTNFTSTGVFQIESESVTYTGKTLTTITGLGRGAYGTAAAAHADNIAIYGAKVYRTKLSLHDGEFNMEAPDSAPTLTITDWDGNAELTETNMTADGTGVYYHDLAILSTQGEEGWEFKYKVIDNSKTNYFHKERRMGFEPARRRDAFGGEGEYYCYEDGYYNSSGTLVLWDDDYDGNVVDSETGVAIDDATVTAYRVEDGVTVPDQHPPGQTKTHVDGSWIMFLDAATYRFTVYKAGIINQDFNRTVTA